MLQPYLFSIFFILISYNQNIDELSIPDLFSVFLVVLPIITILLIIAKLIIKDSTKSVLISSLLVILFFTYTSIHDLLWKYVLFGYNLGSHKILIPLIFVSLIITFFFFLKSHKNFDKLLQISSGIIITMVIFTVVDIANISSIEPLSEYTSDQVFLFEQSELRNIYVIILDEYASTESLMTNFDYDNSNFENFLKDNGFFIPENTFGNYMETRLALPSLLNMNYVNLDSESKRAQDMILQKITRDNLAMKNFKEIGYEIVYFHEENNLQPVKTIENKFCGTFFNNTFLVFVIHGTPLVILNNLTDPFNLQQYIENRLCIFNELLTVDKEFSDPILVHAHIMLPHGPVIFDSAGNTIFEKKLHDAGPSKYVEQLQYANSRVKQVVEKLLVQEPKPIIIILSDHGYRWDFDWNNPTDEQFKVTYPNFMAFYFPEKELRHEDFPIMTPVNTYRILFNTYFGTNYELLDNKMYFRDNYYTDVEGIPALRDITNALISDNNN